MKGERGKEKREGEGNRQGEGTGGRERKGDREKRERERGKGKADSGHRLSSFLFPSTNSAMLVESNNASCAAADPLGAP
jgi:hypothetical protein